MDSICAARLVRGVDNVSMVLANLYIIICIPMPISQKHTDHDNNALSHVNYQYYFVSLNCLLACLHIYGIYVGYSCCMSCC